MSYHAESESSEQAFPAQADESKPLKRKCDDVVVSVDQSDIINPSGRFPSSAAFPVFSVMDGLCIVDKTQRIKFFIEKKNVFVLRPRRFGKSMWLSVLKYFFEYPKGCIDRKLRVSSSSFCTVRGMKFVWKPGTHEHNFPACPVILIDFSAMRVKTAAEYNAALGRILERSYTGYNRKFPADSDLALVNDFVLERNVSAMIMLFDLITALAKRSKWGKVVILVDEYDSCLLTHRGTPDEYEDVRHMHCAFFTLLKSLEPFTILQCVTGITRWKMVDLLSGGNHLNDITFEPEVATLFGFTQGEVDAILKDRKLPRGFAEGMKEQFNGYCFNYRDANLTVYNPVMVIDALSRGLLADWVGVRTASIIDNNDDILRRLNVKSALLSLPALIESDPANLSDTAGVLFHVGCSTIKSVREVGGVPFFDLDYPNESTRMRVFKSLLRHRNRYDALAWQFAGQCHKNLIAALRAKPIPDWVSFFLHMNIFECGIPGRAENSEKQFERELLGLLYLPRVGSAHSQSAQNIGISDVMFELFGKGGSAAAPVYDARFVFELKILNHSLDTIDPFIAKANAAHKQIIDNNYGHSIGCVSRNVSQHFQYTCGLVFCPVAKQIIAVRLGSGVIYKALPMTYKALPMSFAMVDDYEVVYLCANHFANEFETSEASEVFKKAMDLGISPFSLVSFSDQLKEDLRGSKVFSENELYKLHVAAKRIMPDAPVLCQSRTPKELVEHLVMTNNTEQKELLLRHLEKPLASDDITKLDLGNRAAIRCLDFLVETYEERLRLLKQPDRALTSDEVKESEDSAAFARACILRREAIVTFDGQPEALHLSTGPAVGEIAAPDAIPASGIDASSATLGAAVQVRKRKAATSKVGNAAAKRSK